MTLTAELTVRATDNGIRFKGEFVHQGETVVLDLGTMTVEATVVRIEEGTKNRSQGHLVARLEHP